MTSPPEPWATLPHAALGLFFPETCQLCHAERATPTDGYVGPRCWSQVRFIRAPFCERCGLPFEGNLTTKFVCTNCHDLDLHFSSARSSVVARTVVLEAIHRFKYSGALWFENFLADLLLRAAVPVLRAEKWDGIIPVPLHPVKEREREFNQAEVLARHLGDALKIPVETKILRRISPTLTQTKLTRDQRASNMAGAFAVRTGLRLDGRKFILLDDVFTTGATTNACAKALRRAGAAEPCVWTVARGL